MGAQVFAELARVTSGRPNTRGGRYEASLFVYRAFVGMGRKTGATPDGRRAGEDLSQGMGPSRTATGGGADLGRVLDAVAAIDLTAYPVVAVLDAKLPWSSVGNRPEIVVALVQRFLQVGGSVLQLNVLDPATLREARAHPEQFADLVVRVSGYSAGFTTLPPAIQQEIVDRAVAHG